MYTYSTLFPKGEVVLHVQLCLLFHDRYTSSVYSVYCSAKDVLQGGSDISGTSLKCRRRVKMSPFLKLDSTKPCQLYGEQSTKGFSAICITMNQQESTRAVIVSGLRFGQNVKENMNFSSIKKRRCVRRMSGLPARLTANLWTFLCVA
jgi:hypothetical protein